MINLVDCPVIEGDTCSEQEECPNEPGKGRLM